MAFAAFMPAHAESSGTRIMYALTVATTVPHGGASIPDVVMNSGTVEMRLATTADPNRRECFASSNTIMQAKRRAKKVTMDPNPISRNQPNLL